MIKPDNRPLSVMGKLPSVNTVDAYYFYTMMVINMLLGIVAIVVGYEHHDLWSRLGSVITIVWLFVTFCYFVFSAFIVYHSLFGQKK